jgi:hypothetical protein
LAAENAPLVVDSPGVMRSYPGTRRRVGLSLQCIRVAPAIA